MLKSIFRDKITARAKDNKFAKANIRNNNEAHELQ